MIEITVDRNISPVVNFPKLMETKEKDMIVLFINDTTGTILYVSDNNTTAFKQGERYCYFNPKDFVNFDGVLSISNN